MGLEDLPAVNAQPGGARAVNPGGVLLALVAVAPRLLRAPQRSCRVLAGQRRSCGQDLEAHRRDARGRVRRRLGRRLRLLRRRPVLLGRRLSCGVRALHAPHWLAALGLLWRRLGVVLRGRFGGARRGGAVHGDEGTRAAVARTSLSSGDAAVSADCCAFAIVPCRALTIPPSCWSRSCAALCSSSAFCIW